MMVVGHRGSPGFPRFGENTLTSFRKAIEEGAGGFELDVRRCGDGTLVVIHDATVDRTTNGSGRVDQMPYGALRQLDAGHGDHVPSLLEVLEEFAGRCVIHVEVKEPGLTVEVAPIAVQLERVIVSGFDTDDGGPGWRDLSIIASQVPTALLASRRKISKLGPDGLIHAARQYGATALHISRDAVRPELPALARTAGVPVRIWTVNDPREARYWKDTGADAIFSDFPGPCMQALSGESE